MKGKSASRTQTGRLKPMYIYTSLRAFLGFIVLVALFKIPNPEMIPTGILLIMLMILSVELSIEVEERTRVTLGFGLLLTAVLIFPPGFAALVSGAGFALGVLTRSSFSWAHRFKMCYSAAGLCILISAMGSYVFLALGGTIPLQRLDLATGGQVLVVFLTLTIVQSLLILPSIHLRGDSARGYLNTEFPMIVIFNLFSIPIAFAMIILYRFISIWAMVLVGVPLVGAMFLAYNMNSARNDLKQRVKELSILHEISGEITRLLKLEQISDMLHLESRKIISAPGFRLALIAEDSDELLIILDVVDGQIRNHNHAKAANTFEEYIYRSGEELKITHWPEESENLGLQCREEPWVRSYLGVPMRFEEKCLGVIGVRSNRPAAFTDNHINIVKHFANATAVTIENSRLFREEQNAFIATIEAMVKVIEAKDPYTREHSARVADIAVAIAKEMDFDKIEVETIRLAALLHDIGKLSLPEAILHKDGSLDADEIALIQEHPRRGTQILQGIRRLKDVLPAIINHHERIDGKGYPRGISNDAIPISARILSVADTFDAMVTQRPYRNPYSDAEALREIRNCQGTQFDPDVVHAFEQIYARDELKRIYKDQRFQEST